MSKIKWGVGGVVAVATLAVGGNLYADKSLQTYYQQEAKQPSKNLSLNYQNFQMGALQGSADWTAELILDPCKPKEVIKLTGRDQIKRSWNGYQIQSDVKVVQADSALKSLVNQPLKLNTHVNWLGTMKSTLTTPVIVRNEAKIQTRLDPVTLEYRAKPVNDQLQMQDLKLDIPNLTVMDAETHFQMTGLKIETNQGLNGNYLEAGKTTVQMDLLKMADRGLNNPISAELKNYRVEAESDLTDRVLNTKMAVQVGEMKMTFSPVMQNVKFNFNVQDVNRAKLQALFDIIEKSENSCLAQEKLLQDLEPALLAVINEGFKFDSSDNQIKIGTGEAKASLTGRFMPSHQKTLKGMVAMVPSLVEYKADVQFDKNMVASIMNSIPGKAGLSMSDQDIETMLSSMQQSGQLKRDGDVMKMSMEYKYGEKKFLTE
ncbi:DUF945 family protein [Acinetobacter tandoii]|uniref:DUF945 domain-containing protein n=1 Tax=Acinetobacter tandoii DSM 14970 = CIP 107469 TaxID=1120927 RepID=R9B6W0_9GAMM|nr:DUF945 family protein [Acinetobacter tandoii]EOR08121.1 hypothetical protein I593_01476 [Acinetobacter tandoii DSM 14970 = CIP 107469]